LNVSGENTAVTLIVSNCIISGNAAIKNSISATSMGGGLLNECDGAGGGIYNNDNGGNPADSGSATLQIVNSTLTGNSADDGGAIFQVNCAGGARLVIGSTILNNAGIPGGTIDFGSTLADYGVSSLGYNLVSDDAPIGNGGIFFNQPTDRLNTDPMLGPLQYNGGPTFTCARLPGSPAVDKGFNLSGAVYDQRGVRDVAFSRPQCKRAAQGCCTGLDEELANRQGANNLGGASQKETVHGGAQTGSDCP
jgi:hypothetical protein